MNDSRIDQVLALLADAEELLDGVLGEDLAGGDRNQLAAAAQFVTGAVAHLQSVMPRCNREPLGGGRCVLHAGHDGEHYRPWPDREGGFSWTDESQAALADKWGSGRD